MEKFSGKFLGEKIKVQVKNKKVALDLIGRLGSYFDMDSEISPENTLEVSEYEYTSALKKWRQA